MKEFISILYESEPPPKEYIRNLEPDYFLDLNLDQVVNSIMSERSHYNLQPYYYILPDRKETIIYRQDVLKDFSNESLLTSIINFSYHMRNALEYKEYSNMCEHPKQKQRWHVDFVTAYCAALRTLNDCLSSAEIASKGLLKITSYLKQIISMQTFIDAENNAAGINTAFSNLRYGLKLEQEKVTVTINPPDRNYCKQLNSVFGSLGGGLSNMANPLSGAFALSKLEEMVLKIVEREAPRPFEKMELFYNNSQDILDDIIITFEKEVQFYVAFCLYRNHKEQQGFHFSYPMITDNPFHIQGGYDLALANKNASSKIPVVVNDAHLNEQERFFIITGPNQGGKTTFARAMGQIVYFNLLGLMAPCDNAQLPMFSDLITHFSVEESPESGRGKLKDELIRLRSVTDKNTERCFVVLNELFTTAATFDSFQMGDKVLNHFIKKECYGVYVTHIKELAQGKATIASLVAELDNNDRRIRTYQITKRPPDGSGYAESIAEKYDMTYAKMKEVIKS